MGLERMGYSYFIAEKELVSKLNSFYEQDMENFAWGLV